MSKKTKVWSIGDGMWKLHIADESLYMKIRDTLKILLKLYLI